MVKRIRRARPTGCGDLARIPELLGDRALLRRALLLVHLDPALALAIVHALAGAGGRLARALAFASVDARTVDLLARVSLHHRRSHRGEQTRHRASNNRTLHRH